MPSLRGSRKPSATSSPALRPIHDPAHSPEDLSPPENPHYKPLWPGEPPIRAVASFQDYGLEQNGVLATMAPLGQSPPAKLTLAITAYNKNKSRKPFASFASSAAATPELTPPVDQDNHTYHSKRLKTSELDVASLDAVTEQTSNMPLLSPIDISQPSTPIQESNIIIHAATPSDDLEYSEVQDTMITSPEQPPTFTRSADEIAKYRDAVNHCNNLLNTQAMKPRLATYVTAMIERSFMEREMSESLDNVVHGIGDEVDIKLISANLREARHSIKASVKAAKQKVKNLRASKSGRHQSSSRLPANSALSPTSPITPTNATFPTSPKFKLSASPALSEKPSRINTAKVAQISKSRSRTTSIAQPLKRATRSSLRNAPSNPPSPKVSIEAADDRENSVLSDLSSVDEAVVENGPPASLGGASKKAGQKRRHDAVQELDTSPSPPSPPDPRRVAMDRQLEQTQKTFFRISNSGIRAYSEPLNKPVDTRRTASVENEELPQRSTRRSIIIINNNNNNGNNSNINNNNVTNNNNSVASKIQTSQIRKPGKKSDKNWDFCSGCGDDSPGALLVMCDSCPRSYHYKCGRYDPKSPEDQAYYCFWCASFAEKESELLSLAFPPKPAVSVDDELPTSTGSPQELGPNVFTQLIEIMIDLPQKDFALPDYITTSFKHVEKAPNGDYLDTSRRAPVQVRRRHEPAPLQDLSGNPIPKTYSCVGCKKSAHYHNQTTIQCDTCYQFWHLECIDPPLSNPPRIHQNNRTRPYWECPLHIGQDLALMNQDVGFTNTRIHKLRERKNLEVYTPSFSRGHRNNGIIIPELLDSVEEDRIPILSERSIVLDFVEKAKRDKLEHEYRSKLKNNFNNIRHYTLFTADELVKRSEEKFQARLKEQESQIDRLKAELALAKNESQEQQAELSSLKNDFVASHVESNEIIDQFITFSKAAPEQFHKLSAKDQMAAWWLSRFKESDAENEIAILIQAMESQSPEKLDEKFSLKTLKDLRDLINQATSVAEQKSILPEDDRCTFPLGQVNSSPDTFDITESTIPTSPALISQSTHSSAPLGRKRPSDMIPEAPAKKARTSGDIPELLIHTTPDDFRPKRLSRSSYQTPTSPLSRNASPLSAPSPRLHAAPSRSRRSRSSAV